MSGSTSCFTVDFAPGVDLEANSIFTHEIFSFLEFHTALQNSTIEAHPPSFTMDRPVNFTAFTYLQRSQYVKLGIVCRFQAVFGNANRPRCFQFYPDLTSSVSGNQCKTDLISYPTAYYNASRCLHVFIVKTINPRAVWPFSIAPVEFLRTHSAAPKAQGLPAVQGSWKWSTFSLKPYHVCYEQLCSTSPNIFNS